MTLADDLKMAMPQLRGMLRANVSLAPLTWFKTGGPAQAFFEPADELDLCYFLAHCDRSIPVLTIGLGSNLLVRDGGFDGVVVQLGKPFTTIDIGGTTIACGAAVPDVKLASAAAQAGIAGLAYLRGVPGSIGGALRMNAGAYGSETADVMVQARGVDRGGNICVYGPGEMGFAYRHCAVPEDIIFTRASFEGLVGDAETIRKDMAEITAARAWTQPVKTRTGGSTFKNPPSLKAWTLVDKAGCRGLIHGDAQVSELHANFLINRGAATAAHIEDLGEIVRERVLATSGITLEWEIARVGKRGCMRGLWH